jgi:hypothetical protein
MYSTNPLPQVETFSVPFAGFAEASLTKKERSRRRNWSSTLLALVLACAGPAAAIAEAALPADLESAQALYLQGSQALSRGQFSGARLALTQAVTLDPDFAGAWLDLALAAHGDGDTPAAEEFLDILERRFTLPARMTTLVEGLRERIRQQESARRTLSPVEPHWRWRKQMAVGLGHDTNANTGLVITELALTFPDGRVLLPLDPSLHPRGDDNISAGLAIQGQRAAAGGEFEIWGSLKGRHNRLVDGYDTLDAQAGLAWITPAQAAEQAVAILRGPRRYAMQMQHLQLGGRPLFSNLVLSAQQAWPEQGCRPQGAIDLEQRHFPGASNLDSRIYWLGGTLGCPGLLAAQGGRLQAQLRTGLEIARSGGQEGRPGGDTHHGELSLGHQWMWATRNGKTRLDVQAVWLRANDTDGYSPLLQANEARRLRRRILNATYTLPLTADPTGLQGWTAVISLQAYRQKANLGIFESSGRQLQLSLQRGW